MHRRERTHRLLEAVDVDGLGTGALAGTEGSSRNIHQHRNRHLLRDPMDKQRNQQVNQRPQKPEITRRHYR